MNDILDRKVVRVALRLVVIPFVLSLGIWGKVLYGIGWVALAIIRKRRKPADNRAGWGTLDYPPAPVGMARPLATVA